MSPETSTDRSLPVGVLLRRGVPLALLCALVCAALAGLLSGSRPNQYESKSLVLLRQTNVNPTLGGNDGGQTEGEGVGTDAVLVGRRGVLRAVAARPGSRLTVEQLEDAITVKPFGATNVVEITALAERPQDAVNIANAVATEFVRSRQEGTRARARRTRLILTRQRAALSEASRRSLTGVQLGERINELRVLEQLGALTPQVVQRAETTGAPVSPRPRRDAALGGLFGLLLGGGLAILWIASDRRIRQPGEVGDLLGVPVLATMRSRLGHGRHRAVDDEPLRLLHLSLQHVGGGDAPRAVAITPLEGTTGAAAVARGLVEVAAASGETALLITTDLNRHNGLGEPDDDGLRAVLAEGATMEESVRHVHAQDAADYDVLGSRDGRVDLTRGSGLRDLLGRAGEQYSLIVLDTPSPLEHSQAVPLLANADAVVIVALDTPNRQRAERLKARLAALRANPIGVVVRA